jgi:hypothetical protein
MRSRLLATAIATGCAALAAPATAAAAYPSSMDALGARNEPCRTVNALLAIRGAA